MSSKRLNFHKVYSKDIDNTSINGGIPLNPGKQRSNANQKPNSTRSSCSPFRFTIQ